MTRSCSGYKAVERIRDYRFGHVVIDGEAHARDVIVLPVRAWSRIGGGRKVTPWFSTTWMT
jgi:hypothetical protein